MKNLSLRIFLTIKIFILASIIASCSTQTKLIPSSETMCSNGELSVSGVCKVIAKEGEKQLIIGSNGYWAASDNAKAFFTSNAAVVTAYKNTTGYSGLSSSTKSTFFTPSTVPSANKDSNTMVFSRLSQLTLHTLFDLKYRQLQLPSNTTNYVNVINSLVSKESYASTIGSITTLTQSNFKDKSKIAIIGEGVQVVSGLSSASVVGGAFSGTSLTNLTNTDCESGTCSISSSGKTETAARSTGLASIMVGDISGGSVNAGYSPDSLLYSFDVYKDTTSGSVYRQLGIDNTKAAIDSVKLQGIQTLNFAYNLQKLTNETIVKTTFYKKNADVVRYINAIDNFYYNTPQQSPQQYVDVNFLGVLDNINNYLSSGSDNIIITNTGVGIYGSRQGSAFDSSYLTNTNYIGTNFPVFASNKTSQEVFVYNANGYITSTSSNGSALLNIKDSSSIESQIPNDIYYQYTPTLATDGKAYIDSSIQVIDDIDSWNAGGNRNYNSFLPGVINYKYNSLVNNGGLLVSAVSAVGTQGTDTTFEGIVSNTLSCGAFSSFCVTVPVSDTQKVWDSKTGTFVDLNTASSTSVFSIKSENYFTTPGQYGTLSYPEVGSAILTSVVDNVRKMFTNSSYTKTDENSRADVVNFIKQNLTDKKYGQEMAITTSSISSMDAAFKALYGSNAANVSRSKGVMFTMSAADDAAAITNLEAFINNMGYKDVVLGYLNNANADKVGLGGIAVNSNGTVDITATSFNAAFAALSKFLVADDIKITVGSGSNAITYLNGQVAYSIKDKSGKVLFYCTNATCKGSDGYLDPSKVIASNIFGLGILNTSEDVTNKYFILTNDSAYTSSKVALVPSTVFGNGFSSPAFNSAMSTVSAKIVSVNDGSTAYSYSSDLTSTIQSQNSSMSSFNESAFFSQSNFNARKFNNKSTNIFGLNINIRTSTFNDDESNLISKTAMLASGFQSPFSSQISNYSIGGEFGKFSFSSFSGSSANLQDDLDANNSAFAISGGNYSGMIQINNFSDIVGYSAKGGVFGYNVDKNNSILFNYASSNLSQNTYYGGFAQKFNSFSSVSVKNSDDKTSSKYSLGILQERGGFLGTIASGPFGANATTLFASAAGKLDFKNSYFAGYKAQYGITTVKNAVGILQNFSLLQSASYSIFAGKNKILSKNDSLTFGINSPLAIVSGSVDVNNGYNNQKFNLASSNRWMAAELGYNVKVENIAARKYASFGLNIAHTQNKYNIANANDNAALVNGTLYW